jgi:hypothetical protein
LIVTKNTKYALRAANPWVADRPTREWLPKGRIVMTPSLPPNYYLFNVTMIVEFTFSKLEPIQNMKFSLLVSPGKYLVDLQYVLPVQTDITGSLAQQSLEQLEEEGRKILQGCESSSSVVLEFVGNSKGLGYSVPPLGLSLSRLSFIDMNKSEYYMFEVNYMIRRTMLKINITN